MLLSDRPAFEAELRQLEDVFGKKLDDGTLALYWNALHDISLGAFKARCLNQLKHGKFFPKPSELRPKGDAEDTGPQLSAAARSSVHMALMELTEKDPIHNGHLRQALIDNSKNWIEKIDAGKAQSIENPAGLRQACVATIQRMENRR